MRMVITMKKCAVLGSINMDMVISVDRFPVAGESRIGTGFVQTQGGKGGNQAVALARLGADVVMAGCVGNDAFGDAYIETFKKNGVDTGLIARVDGVSTGLAFIEVEESGENRIIAVNGANALFKGDKVCAAVEAMKDRDIFLFQLETDHESAFEAIKAFHDEGKTVILDPAPAAAIPDWVFQYVDIITPNETELIAVTPDIEGGKDERMRALYSKGVRTVINKCGKYGAYVFSGGEIEHVPGFEVKAVDTTAAGDTFNAGLARALSEDMDMLSAVRYANAAAALSVTALGAQGGMPTDSETRDLMKGR